MWSTIRNCIAVFLGTAITYYLYPETSELHCGIVTERLVTTHNGNSYYKIVYYSHTEQRNIVTSVSVQQYVNIPVGMHVCFNKEGK